MLRYIFRPLYLLNTILLICIKIASAQSVTQNPEPSKTLNHKRDFNWKDLYQIKKIADIQISPDGKTILFTRSNADSLTNSSMRAICMIDINSSKMRQWSTTGSYSPRWSPNGKQIAFISQDSSGVPVLKLSPKDDFSSSVTLMENPGDFCWSPDCKKIAFTKFIADNKPTLGLALLPANAAVRSGSTKIFMGKHIFSDGGGETQPGFTHLFTVSIETKVIKQITTGQYNVNTPFTWTSDSKSLLFCAARSVDHELVVYDESLYAVNIIDGEIKQMTSGLYGVREPAVSPDGTTIAFVACRKNKKDYEKGELFLIKNDGCGLRALADGLDREITQPHWTPDSKAILVVYGDQGITKLGSVSIDDNISVIAEGIDGDESFGVAAKNIVAYAKTTAGLPGEIFVASGGRVIQLTHLNDSLFNEIKIGMQQLLPVRSNADGKSVGAWITYPPNFDKTNKYPLILSIHGGPHGYDGPRWSAEAQIFASAGYLVLNVNYRGSTSYGFSFADQTYNNFPGPAYGDLMDAVDAIIHTGITDPQRLFVTGGSAGGELTAWIVGKTNRFRAAASVKPVIDLIAHAFGSDQYVASSKYSFSKTPWQDPLLYWRNSPLSIAFKVNTPTLIMVGENDRRTPLTESLQFYNALQLKSIPSALVVVPQASHETLNRQPLQLANNSYIILDWFSRYGGNKIR